MYDTMGVCNPEALFGGIGVPPPPKIPWGVPPPPRGTPTPQNGAKIRPNFFFGPSARKSGGSNLIASNSGACHQGELATRLKGSKSQQKGPKRGPKCPQRPKRAQRGKICPKYCQYFTKTGQESQNFDIRRHNYARGWSLRQHIGLK